MSDTGFALSTEQTARVAEGPHTPHGSHVAVEADRPQRVFRAIAVASGSSMRQELAPGVSRWDVARACARAELLNVSKSLGSRAGVIAFDLGATTMVRRRFATDWLAHSACDGMACSSGVVRADLAAGLDAVLSSFDNIAEDIKLEARLIVDGELLIDEARLVECAEELHEMDPDVHVTFIDLSGDGASDAVLIAAALLAPYATVKVVPLAKHAWALGALRTSVERAVGWNVADCLPAYLPRAFSVIPPKPETVAFENAAAEAACGSRESGVPELAVA
jgi:hypothetical protein